MTNNPNEIIEEYEAKEQISDKQKKKKPKTKKADHKHVYDKYVIKEEKLETLFGSYTLYKDKTQFSIYKKCSVCGKLIHENLPQYIEDDLANTFEKNSKKWKYFYFCISNRDEVEYIEKNYPEIEICYLEK